MSDEPTRVAYACLVHTGVAACQEWVRSDIGRGRSTEPWDRIVEQWRRDVAIPFWEALRQLSSNDGLRIDSFVYHHHWLLGEGVDSAIAYVELVDPDGRRYGHRTDVEGGCWFGSDELAAVGRDWGGVLVAARASNPYDFWFERLQAEREMVQADLGDSYRIELFRGSPKARFAAGNLAVRDPPAELEYERARDGSDGRDTGSVDHGAGRRS
jgi:hypothetical protein